MTEKPATEAPAAKPKRKRSRGKPIQLSPQDEIAINHRISGRTMTDSWLLAGWSANSRGVACTRASNYFAQPKIMIAVAERLARAAEKAEIDRSYIMGNLRRIAEISSVVIETPSGETRMVNENAALRAYELMGKDIGMFVERREHGKPGDFANQTTHELRAKLVERARIAGIDPRTVEALLSVRPSGTA